MRGAAGARRGALTSSHLGALPPACQPWRTRGSGCCVSGPFVRGWPSRLTFRWVLLNRWRLNTFGLNRKCCELARRSQRTTARPIGFSQRLAIMAGKLSSAIGPPAHLHICIAPVNYSPIRFGEQCLGVKCNRLSPFALREIRQVKKSAGKVAVGCHDHDWDRQNSQRCSMQRLVS